MKKLSGHEIIKALSLFGFEQVRQKGSHVVLQICKFLYSQTLSLININLNIAMLKNMQASIYSGGWDQ